MLLLYRPLLDVAAKPAQVGVGYFYEKEFKPKRKRKDFKEEFRKELQRRGVILQPWDDESDIEELLMLMEGFDD